jgi:Sel1 repeat
MKKVACLLGVLLGTMLTTLSAGAADFYAARQAYMQGDFAFALAEFYELAMQGDPESQFALGVMNYLGSGKPIDYPLARAWFDTSARTGHIDAQYQLGEMFRLGQGGPQDTATAVNLFQLAANRGHDMAKYALAMMVAMGDGIPPNRPAAIAMLREVAQSQDLRLASMAQQALAAIDVPLPPPVPVSSPPSHTLEPAASDNMATVKSFVQEHPFLTAMGALLVYSAMTDNNANNTGQSQNADDDYRKWEEAEKEKRDQEQLQHDVKCNAYQISSDKDAKIYEGCP